MPSVQSLRGSLYLARSRAARDYVCPACQQTILKGSAYYRHDPHPGARRHRNAPRTHWCDGCISKAPGKVLDPANGRILISPVALVMERDVFRSLRIPHVASAGIGAVLAKHLAHDPQLIHELTPDEFEQFVCDRLFAMGMEPRRVGAINRKDGGIDVLFWPRDNSFPFLGAAQMKHHRDPRHREGPSSVRDFAGAIAGHPISAGLLVTNTHFTPDAEWFARERAKLVRLRDFVDLARWLTGTFNSPQDWREIPSALEVCPGLVVKVR